MGKKSGFTIVSLLIILALVAAGCGNTGKNNASGETVFRMNLSSEPPSMDPAQITDQVSATVLNGMYEGLTRKNESGEVEPGMAESWVISDDGLTYTFKLRENALWSNGDPVTANDFEYAWKRALDPALKPKPSEYAYQLFYIKGAEAFNTGNGSADDVAVKATDEHTLEVVLNSPTPYFLGLMSFQTYFPVHPSTKDNEAWATEASTQITNGAFTIQEWKKNTSITLAKNDHYYAKDAVGLDKVMFTMVNDSGTELSMYQTDSLDFTGMPTGLIPIDQVETLKAQYPDEFAIKGIASTYYYLFNTENEVFKNEKIREAFSMAISRKDLAEKVALGGEVPAYGFVPPGIKGVKDEFRSEVNDSGYFTEDYAEAKKLLAEGLSELGLTEMPEFKILYNTNDKHQKLAEAIAEMWRQNLGVKVGLDTAEWGVYLETRNSLNYDVSRGGWGADYNDPMSFLDLMTSWSGNNNTGFKSPEYDALIKQAYSSNDAAERMSLLADAEKLLIDSRAIMPLFYYTSVNMIKPGFENIFIDFKGDIDYTRGYYEAK